MSIIKIKETLNKYRPTLTVDGDQFCLLHGNNLQEGVAGFGSSIVACLGDFVINAIIFQKQNTNEYDTEIDDETMD